MRSTLGVYDEQELDMYRDRFEVKNIISRSKPLLEQIEMVVGLNVSKRKRDQSR